MLHSSLHQTMAMACVHVTVVKLFKRIGIVKIRGWPETHSFGWNGINEKNLRIYLLFSHFTFIYMGEKDLQKYTSPARWDRGSGTKAQRGCTGPIGRAVPRNDGYGTGSVTQNGGVESSCEPTPARSRRTAQRDRGGRAERQCGTASIPRTGAAVP